MDAEVDGEALIAHTQAIKGEDVCTKRLSFSKKVAKTSDKGHFDPLWMRSFQVIVTSLITLER